MPIISMFYGIIVAMYFLDNKKHKMPHIHVKYQENEAVISIPDGELLEGQIPGNKLKLVMAWIEIHRDELMADWELASKGESPYKIDPLK
jgi:shikimate kinase